MEKEIYTEPFKDLVILVNGVPAELNVIGALKHGEKEYLVINDMDVFNLSADEYGIMELVRYEGHVSIKWVEDEEFHNTLCDMWEKAVDEMEEEDEA